MDIIHISSLRHVVYKKVLIFTRKNRFIYFLQAIKCSGVVIEISAMHLFLFPFMQNSRARERGGRRTVRCT